jgi:hypothetical protein
VNAIARIGNYFEPDLCGAFVLTAALGHQRKLAAGFGADFLRQSDRQRLCARGVRAIFLSPALKES